MSRNEVDNEHLNEFITNLNIVGHQVGVPGPILDQFKTSLVQLVASRQNSIKIDENKQSKHELDLATDCFLTLRLSGLDLAPNRDDDQTRYEINNGNNNNDDVDFHERNRNEKTENNEYHPMIQQQNDDINFDNKFNNYNIRNNHNNDFNVEHSNNHNANNNNAFCNDGFNGNRSSNNHNAMYNNNSDFNNQDRYYNHNVNHYVNPKEMYNNNNNNASPMMYTSDFNNQYRHSVNPKGVNNYNTNARSPMYNSEFNNQEMFKDSDSPHYLNNTDLTKYNNNNINYNKDNNNFIIPTNIIPPNDIDTPEARDDDFNSNNHNDKIIAGKEKYNNKDIKGKCCSNKICCFDLQSETSDINYKNERLRSRTERNLAGRNRFSKAIYSRKNNNNNNYSNMINNRGTTDAESTYNGDDVEKPSEKLEIKTFASEALRELGDMQKELMRKISKRKPKKRPVAWEKKNKNNGRGGRDLSYLAKDKNNKRYNFRRNGNDNLSSNNNRKKAGQDSEKFDVLEQAERDKFKKDFYRVRNRDGKQTRQTEFTLNKLYNGQDSSSSESTYVVDNSSSYLKKRMKNNNRMTSSDSFSSSDDDISVRDIESLIMLIEDLKGELLVLVKTNLPLLKMKISIIRKRFTEIIRNEL